MPRQRLSESGLAEISSESGARGTATIALRAGAIAGLIQCIFQTAKYVFLPDTGVWHSDFVTICLVTLAVAMVIFYVLEREERLRVEMRLQETRYRLLFGKSLIGGYRSTLDGLILDCNVTFCRTFGYSERHEVIGQRVDIAYFNKMDRARFIERLQADGEVTNFEQQMRRKDGSTVWILTNASLVANELGEGCVIQGTVIDVTERKRSEEAVRQAEEKYRAIFENSVLGIFQRTPDGRLVNMNRAFAEMLGYDSPEQMMEENPDRASMLLIAPGQMAKWFQQSAENGIVHGIEFEIDRRDRTRRWVRASLRAIRDASDTVVLYEGTVEDISERKRAEEALLFKTALLEAQSETTIDGILVVDEFDHIVLANRQFGLIFAIPDEILGTRDDRLVREYVTDQVENPEGFIERVKHLNSNREERSADEIRLKNGKILDRYTAPLIDANKRHCGRIWYFRDITERRAAEKRIQFLAYHDALTELPHRALLQDRLDSALADARRREERVALLFLDLDRFKNINDSVGHASGDLVLKDIAQRLKECARAHDTVARVGGDEFLILLNNVRDAGEVATAADRIMDAMSATFVVDGHSFHMGCSIGVSMFPDNGVDGDILIQNADIAMYCAKESGRGNVRFFTDELNSQAAERRTMDKDLRAALVNEEFFLLYQPQMEIESGRITGVEALIRWQHPTKGLVPPDKFIPIAETNRMILPIGKWVLRTACAQARKWQDEGLPAVSVAVNVSPVQFHQEGFCALIRAVLEETGLSPQYLELELTEGLLLSDADATLAVLRELKEMGLKLAIDDFGTGYSSLSYLRQFPVDKLKIDRSFVRDITTDCDDAAITTAIISMAKSLHLKVIAEGVEDELQLRFLQEQGCDEIQGYYLGRPAGADEAAFLLQCIQSGSAGAGRRMAAMEAATVLSC